MGQRAFLHFHFQGTSIRKGKIHAFPPISSGCFTTTPPNYLHQKISFSLARKIADHIDSNHGLCEVVPAPFAVNLNADDKTWVEPDISVICDKDKISDRGCEGAPDWIIEVISPSTQSRDHLKKLLLYQNAGVREYWIVNPKFSSTTVYNFETSESYSYSFEEPIQAGIFVNLQITIFDLIH